jgi:polyisoprenoid-binding protein YceI
MTTTTGPQPQPTGTAGRPRRRRHWLRWLLITGAAGLVLLVGVVAVAVQRQPVPAPLALPAATTAPTGPLDGTYQAASGSEAGFRIQQTVLGLHSEVVGRTAQVTGAVTVTGGTATAASLRVDLRTLTTGNGKPAPQFATSLDTRRYPDATIALARPVVLGAAVASGGTATVDATGTLSLHGVVRTVTVPLRVRRDGAGLDVVGSFPVRFSGYRITGPAGYGPLGSLADHGTAEFLLLLRPA